MVDVFATGDRIEERSDLGTGDTALHDYWMMQEKIAEKEERKWVKRSREIVKRYRDERPELMQSTHRFNILWSNVETLKPTLYARTPKPDVDRRNKDPKNPDPVPRLAATLLEKALAYSVEMHDFDGVMKSVVEDRLLPGRGVARVLYVPHFGEPIREEENAEYETTEDAPSVVDGPGDETKDDQHSETGGGVQPDTEDDLREVDYEECLCKYVFWEDYREGPARKWDEVPWVRYRSYMIRDELIARFGKKKGKQVNLDFTPKGGTDLSKDDPPQDLYKKAIIHEVWDKTKKQVVWYAPGTPDVILDKQDDPLRLPGFFPNPDPLLATTTNDRRIPVPDFIEYQDQARELDTLTSRIDRLTRALKVSGIYAGAEKQVLQQLIDEGTENRLIPVEDWASFAMDKGGLENLIQWMPIKDVAETLIRLYDARDRSKAILYETTGIGDILRGETDPRETMGAQQLKANFATRRIVPQQKDVAKFARDILRLMGALIAEHFAAKTISMITGYPQLMPVPPLPPQPQAPQMPPQPSPVVPAPMGAPGPPPQPGAPAAPQAPPANPAMVAYQKAMQAYQQQVAQIQQIVAQNQQRQQQFAAAVELLKQDAPHDFVIDIEADSTIAPDEQEEKAARVEFLEQIVPFLESTVPLAQGNPPMAALLGQIGLFAVHAFKVSRPLEEAFDTFFDQLGGMPPNPNAGGKGKGGNPAGDIAMAQADMQDSKLRAQTDVAETQAKTQAAQQANAVKAQEIVQQAQIEREKMAQEAQLERERMTIDVAQAADEQQFRRAREEAAESRSAAGLP